MPNELAAGEEIPRKKPRRRLIIILFLLLFIIGGLAGVWFFVLGGKMPFLRSAETVSESSPISTSLPSSSDKPAVLGNIVPLSVFTVNLADPLGRRVMSINISLELSDPSAVDEIRRQDPRIRDAVIILLSSKSYADIASADSKMILKSEITGRVNQLLGEPKVSHTFITNMLIK